MKKLLIILLCLFYGEVLIGQAPGAAGNDTTLSCYDGSPVQIGNSNYNFAFSNTGITFDDQYGAVVPIGFTFNFFGIDYTTATPGSNGVLNFNNPGGGCPYVINGTNSPIPNPNAILNCIMGPWVDINVSFGGTIDYGTIGVAPNRVFVLQWCDAEFYLNFSSSCGPTYSGQIVLFETTNNIEIHIENITTCTGWNGGLAIEGIHDPTGTIAFTVPGRNATQWSANFDAWRFSPTGPSTYQVDPIPYNPVFLPNLPTTFSWYEVGNPVAIGTGMTLNVTPTSNTCYVLESNTSSCLGSYKDTICVTPDIVNYPNVIGSISGVSGANLTICTGPTITLSANNGSPGATYSWSPTTGLSNPNDSITTVTPTSSISYICTFQTASGCTDSDTVNIDVTVLTAVSIDPPVSTICAGSAQTLTASGAFVYSWSPTASIDTAAGSTVIANPATTTTYTVLGSIPGCPGAMQALSTLTVNPVPVLTINPSSPVDVCENTTAQLGITSNVAGSTFSWTPATGLSATNIGNPIFNGTDSVNYSITVNADGCIVDTTLDVNWHPTPTVVWASPLPGAWCQSSPDVVLSGGTGTPAGGTGVYSGAGVTGNVFDPGAITAAPDATVNTDLWFIYEDPFGCTDSVMNTVTVTGNPTVTLTSSLNPICFNDPTNVTFDGLPAGGVYSGTGLNPAGSSNFNATPAAGISAAGTYTITYQYTNAIAGCTGTATVDQIVWPLPTPFFNNLNSMYCVVDPVFNLDATPSPGTVTGGFFKVDGSVATTFDPTTLPSGTHQVVYTFTDGNNCTDSVTQNVAVNELPVLSIVGLAPTYCEYDATVTLMGLPSGSTGVFSGPGISGNTFAPADANPGVSNTIVYDYTDPATNCSNTTSQNTTVIYKPISDFTANPPATSIVNPSISFLNNTQYFDASLWTFGDQVGTSTLTNPTYLFPDTGTYLVTLVSSNQGCLDTVSAEVLIMPEFVLYLPNAFTPNGDFNNDAFYAQGQGIAEFEMSIFDRWGNMIYVSKSITDAWTGNDAPSGMYVYKINAVDLEGKTFEYVGQVSLLR